MSKLHTYGQNRIWRDASGFVRVGSRVICRYLPGQDTLQFQYTTVINGHNAKRFIEVEKSEFLERLTEVLT
jgi:hypothetical protein